MTEYPEALVERAIRAGCTAADIHIGCSWPNCNCKQIPTAIRAALDASGLREVVEAASAFEDDLSEYCDGPKRDRLRTVLARIKGEPHA